MRGIDISSRALTIACVSILCALCFSLRAEEGGELYIVLLKETPIARSLEIEGQTLRGSERRALLSDRRLSPVRRRIKEQQDRVLERVRPDRLSGADLSRSREESFEVLRRSSLLLNALILRGGDEAIRRFSEDPEVTGVYPAVERRPVMDQAGQLLGAPALWQSLGGQAEAGRGISIAVIDSGIETAHPMFDDSAMTLPAGYPLGNAAFTNRKVISARSYHELFPNPNGQEDRTPRDETGHGSQVAGVAAGREVTGPLGPLRGIAPMAYLGNYKVFGTPGLNSTTTSLAVFAAIEDAVSDGMDIINLSLGGSSEEGTVPEEAAIENATRLGVVVVIAAGNIGPEARSVTAPGTSPNAITVGAVTHGRIQSAWISVEAQGGADLPRELERIPYNPGGETEIPEAIGPYPLSPLLSVDPSGLACVPLPGGSLEGRLALVKRGACTFQSKAKNVFGAGAAGLVVYNNLTGGTIRMSFSESLPGPAVMVDLRAGEALLELSTEIDLQVTLQPDSLLDTFSSTAGILTGFSGRGPTHDFRVKPDLVAIGTEVYTASNSADSYTLGTNGTSFATPMVAGAAALLRQLHPAATPQQIRSLLLLSSDPSVLWNNRAAATVQRGAGMLNLESAASATLAVEPSLLSLGPVREVPLQLERQISLENLSDQTREYEIGVEMTRSVSGAEVTVEPGKIVLSPHQQQNLNLQIALSEGTPGGVLEGSVQVVDSDSGHTSRVWFWGPLLQPAGQTHTVSPLGDGDFATVGQALQNAWQGDRILITGDGPHLVEETIRYNRDGVLLDGLRLEAAEGSQPVLDATGLAATSVLTLDQVQNVSIEGLHIRGAREGIRFQGSSGSVRHCRIEADPASGTGYGLVLDSNSRGHIYRNDFLSAGGSAIAVFSADALIQGNVIDGRSSVDLFPGHGILAASTGNLGLFYNRIQGVGFFRDSALRFSSSNALLSWSIIDTLPGTGTDAILVRSPLSRLKLYQDRIHTVERNGIRIREGANVTLEAVTIEGAEAAGLLLEPGTLAEGKRLRLTENGSGLVARESLLLLSDSLIAHSPGHGVSLTDSQIFLTNATIADNGQGGVVASAPTAGRISNSIIFGNGTFDLSGIPADDIQFSLLGSSELEGLQGNISADPLFRDPSSGDFRLRPGSPAIDAGDNAQAESSFDLLGNQRIVDGPGSDRGQIDMGALEAYSSSAPSWILPLLRTSQKREFTGLAFAEANPLAAEPTRIQIRHFHPAGLPGENRNLQTDPESQISRLASEVVGTVDEGWLQISPTSTDLVGFSLSGDYALNSLDGVPLSRAFTGEALLPVLQSAASDFSRLTLVNPTRQRLGIELVRSEADGSTIESRRLALDPHTMSEVLIGEPGEDLQSQYLRIRPEDPGAFYSIGTFGTAYSFAALSAIPADEASPTLFGAQLAASETIQTRIDLVNRGGTGTVRLEAVSDSGEVLAEVEREMASGEKLSAKASQLFSLTSDFVGWLRVRSDDLQLIGALTFESPRGHFLASLPLTSRGAREFLLSHVALTPEIFTGVTLLNPTAQEALFSLEVFEPSGEKPAVYLDTLDAGEKRALLLREWVPGLPRQEGGFIRVRSNSRLVGFELFGSERYLASVPAQVTVE